MGIGGDGVVTSFKLGSIVCTRGVFELMKKDFDFSEFVRVSLVRHSMGDWGDLCAEDRQANESALVEGSRILSAYETDGQPKIWIITEADRTSTCVLFPSEY